MDTAKERARYLNPDVSPAGSRILVFQVAAFTELFQQTTLAYILGKQPRWANNPTGEYLYNIRIGEAHDTIKPWY